MTQPNKAVPSAQEAPAQASVGKPPTHVSWFSGYEGWWLIAALVLAWQWVSSLHFSGNYLFPSPLLSLKALFASLPELLRGTVSSFLILVPSYLLAVLAGVSCGLLVGTRPLLQRLFSPLSRLASPIPTTIYVPYAIALLPNFRSAAGFVVFAGAFWPIFLNTAAGAANLPQRYRDNARILGLKGIEYLRVIVLPASLPHIFTGLSVSLVFSFILLTVAELFGANAGLGRFIQLYADYADYPRMVAGILYTGAVVLLCTELLERLKRRALFWVR